MSFYEHVEEHGRRVAVENEGEMTHVHVGSSGGGQQQSQSTGFQTGAWTGEPKLFRQGAEWVLRLQTRDGTRVLRITSSGVRQASGDEGDAGGEELPLRKAGGEPAPRMEPMKPMQPMKPMEPMRPMRPMEMRMGNMQMRMGGEAQGKRYCTKCGQPVGADDRYCGSCGAPI